MPWTMRTDRGRTRFDYSPSELSRRGATPAGATLWIDVVVADHWATAAETEAAAKEQAITMMQRAITELQKLPPGIPSR